MLEPDEIRAKALDENGEVTFSILLADQAVRRSPKTAVGMITWSFIANPKLELVDMYVDLV